MTFKLTIAEWRQRNFPDPVVKQALGLLNDCDDLFETELMWPGMKRRVRAGLLLTSKASRPIIADANKCSQLILELLTSVSVHQIEFGDHHIYRNVLSDIGRSYRSIAENALGWLLEYGYWSQDRYEAEVERIAHLVKRAG